MTDIREYSVHARSTVEFGRVLCSARTHHFVVDGPVQNGCPGEAITPAEVFLSGVAACGVELLQVLARTDSLALNGVTVRIEGKIDRSAPVRSDYSLFNSVLVHFGLQGVSKEEGAALVEQFKGR